MHREGQISIPKQVAGVCIPDSVLARDAMQFVREATPLWLMHHLMRTYVFAELLGRKSGMKYDSELLYLGVIMHDLGLTWDYAGAQRFELDGADVAKKFLLHRDVPNRQVKRVWEAIAFHTSRGLYDRMSAEVALVGSGVLADATGVRTERLSPIHVQEVLETWPRHGFRDAFPKLVAEVVGRKPETAMGSFAADVLRDRGIVVPTVCEAMEQAPF